MTVDINVDVEINWWPLHWRPGDPLPNVNRYSGWVNPIYSFKDESLTRKGMGELDWERVRSWADPWDFSGQTYWPWHGLMLWRASEAEQSPWAWLS